MEEMLHLPLCAMPVDLQCGLAAAAEREHDDAVAGSSLTVAWDPHCVEVPLSGVIEMQYTDVRDFVSGLRLPKAPRERRSLVICSVRTYLQRLDAREAERLEAFIRVCASVAAAGFPSPPAATSIRASWCRDRDADDDPLLLCVAMMGIGRTGARGESTLVLFPLLCGPRPGFVPGAAAMGSTSLGVPVLRSEFVDVCWCTPAPPGMHLVAVYVELLLVLIHWASLTARDVGGAGVGRGLFCERRSVRVGERSAWTELDVWGSLATATGHIAVSDPERGTAVLHLTRHRPLPRPPRPLDDVRFALVCNGCRRWRTWSAAAGARCARCGAHPFVDANGPWYRDRGAAATDVAPLRLAIQATLPGGRAAECLLFATDA